MIIMISMNPNMVFYFIYIGVVGTIFKHLKIPRFNVTDKKWQRDEIQTTSRRQTSTAVLLLTDSLSTSIFCATIFKFTIFLFVFCDLSDNFCFRLAKMSEFATLSKRYLKVFSFFLHVQCALHTYILLTYLTKLFSLLRVAYLLTFFF